MSIVCGCSINESDKLECKKLYFSFACAIQEEQEVTITGGSGSGSKVTRYQMSGQSEALPNLVTGRSQHTCGVFTNTDGNIVSYYNFNTNISPLTIM